MPAPDLEQQVRINVGACRCSGTPHDPDGDWVELRPKLSAAMGTAAMSAMTGVENEPGVIEAVSTGVLVHLGISDWSFQTPKGEKEPVTRATIDRLIPWTGGYFELGEKAWELYGDDLMLPLLRGRSRQSANGRTGNGTRRTRSTGSRSPKSSPPSSPVSTDTSSSEAPAQ